MSIFGTYDWVISLSSSFFYILLIPVVYIFARRVLEFDIPSSIVSTLVIMTNGILAEGAIFGMSEPAAVFFFLTFLFFVRKKQHQYAYYLAGIIAGLAYLNRIESLIWIIIIVGLLFFRKFPKKDLQKLIMSFLVIVLPYWIYNFSKTGNPFFSLQSFIVLVVGTSSFTYYPYAESLYINPIIFIQTHFFEVLIKWIRNAWNFFWSFPQQLGMPLSLVFFIAWVFKKGDKKENFIKAYVIVSFFTLAGILFFMIPEIRFFAIFVPFIGYFGTFYFRTYIKPLSTTRIYYGLVIVYILINSIGLAVFVHETKNQTAYRYSEEEFIAIQKHFDEKAVIASNIWRGVGWYGKRKSVSLPKNIGDVNNVSNQYVEIDGIFLESSDLYHWLPVWDLGWRDIEKEAPLKIEDYVLVEKFPSGSLLYKKYK